MGLDYAFILMVEEQNKHLLYHYVSLHAESLDMTYGKCLTIQFKSDPFLERFIEDDIPFKFSKNLFSRSKEKNTAENKEIRIGCIYMQEHKLPFSAKVEIRFVAATTGMSILFFDSPSIQEWFVQASVTCKAILTYLDEEDNGVKFLYFKEQKLNISIDLNLNPRKGPSILPQREIWEDLLAHYKLTLPEEE